MYTAHCDASVRSQVIKASIGYVIFDPDNRVVVEHSEPIKFCNSMEAEIEAMIKLLTTIVSLEIKDIKIVSDCKSMIRMIKNKCRIKSNYREYIEKIKSMLFQIGSYSLDWVRRKYNKYAHQLAKLKDKHNPHGIKIGASCSVSSCCIDCGETKFYKKFSWCKVNTRSRKKVCKDCEAKNKLYIELLV